MSSADKENLPANNDETGGQVTAPKGASQPSKSTKTVWKSQDSALLIETLLKEREAGHQSDTGFKPVAWTACATALKGSEVLSGGIAKTASSARDHFAKLKKDFNTVKKIKEQSGFGWDNTLKIATAPDDVWEKYIAVHKKAKIWRTKRFPLFDSIQILIDGIVATGENSFRAGTASQVLIGEVVPHMSDGDGNISSDEDGGKSDDDKDDLEETPAKGKGRKRPAVEMTPLYSVSTKRQQTGSRSVNRSGSGRSGTDAMFSVAGAIETLAESFAEPSGGLKSPERRKAAIQLLDKDDDLSENEQVQAIRLFSRHTSIADTYLAIQKKGIRTLYIQSELSEA